MGQDSSKSVREVLDSQFKYIKKYSNNCYGELTLVQAKSNFKRYALKQIVSDNSSIGSILSKKKQQNLSNIINLIEYWVKGQPSLCSSISQVYLLLEYQEMTLQEEIIQRQSKQKFFTIAQIKKIIQTSIFAMQQLSKSKNNFHIGLENTLISKEGQIKIVQPDLITDNLLSSQPSNSKKKYYPCEEPQMTYQSQQEQYPSSEGSKVKASVFYLGVMALSCCLLDQTLQDQVITNGGYDFDRLRRISRSCSERYQKFSQFIEKMIKKNPFKRPSYCDILLQVSPKRLEVSKKGSQNMEIERNIIQY